MAQPTSSSLHSSQALFASAQERQIVPSVQSDAALASSAASHGFGESPSHALTSAAMAAAAVGEAAVCAVGTLSQSDSSQEDLSLSQSQDEDDHRCKEKIPPQLQILTKCGNVLGILQRAATVANRVADASSFALLRESWNHFLEMKDRLAKDPKFSHLAESYAEDGAAILKEFDISIERLTAAHSQLSLGASAAAAAASTAGASAVSALPPTHG